MTLSFAQRINLLQILPEQGNIITLRVIQDLRKSLAATDEEIKKYKIKNISAGENKTTIVWSPEFSTEIEIGDTAKDIIKKRIEELNTESKLTENLISLYDIFVPKK